MSTTPPNWSQRMQWLTPPLVIFSIGLVLFFVSARFQALPQVAGIGTGFGVFATGFVVVGLIWGIVRLIKGPPTV